MKIMDLIVREYRLAQMALPLVTVGFRAAEYNISPMREQILLVFLG
jgi:hypothetical protein